MNTGILRRISHTIDTATQWIGHGVAWLTLVVVVLGAFNAVARFLAKAIKVDLSSNAFLELQWQMFAILFLLGAAYTLKEDRHVRVDVLYDRLRPGTRLWINLIGHTLLLIPFCILMIWASWPMVTNSWKQWEMSPNPGGLPLYPIKTMLPVAFLLLLIQGVSEILKVIIQLVEGGREPAGAELQEAR